MAIPRRNRWRGIHAADCAVQRLARWTIPAVERGGNLNEAKAGGTQMRNGFLGVLTLDPPSARDQPGFDCRVIHETTQKGGAASTPPTGALCRFV